MKKWLLLAGLAFVSAGAVQAQVETPADTSSPYLKTGKLPGHLRIGRLSGGVYSLSQLQAKTGSRPMVITYFSPTCGHCQMEATALKDSIGLLANTAVMWMSAHPAAAIQSFDSTYRLQAAGVMVARDEDYVLAPYFDVRFTPFTVLTRPDGTVYRIWRKGASVVEIADAVKSLH